LSGATGDHNRFLPNIPTAKRPFSAEILLHQKRAWGQEPVWLTAGCCLHAAILSRHLNQSWPWPPTLRFRADQEPNLLKTNTL
jgi:hypothetical protein